MIYIFDNIECFYDKYLELTIGILPAERREKLNNYKRIIDKKLCLIAHLLLLYGLKKEFNIDTDIEFSYDQYGKPYIKNSTDIFFNISHCKEGVACILSRKEVGIDIQDYITYDKNLVRIICTGNELQELQIRNRKDEFLTQLWTLKESYLKCIGTGINERVSEIDFSGKKSSSFKYLKHNFTIIKSEKYCIAVCGNDYSKIIKKVGINELLQFFCKQES